MLAELAGAHRRRWTHADELLALILERLDALYNLTEHVNTKQSARRSRLPKAYRYPRPKPPRAKVRYSTPDEVRAFFKR